MEFHKKEYFSVLNRDPCNYFFVFSVVYLVIQLLQKMVSVPQQTLIGMKGNKILTCWVLRQITKISVAGDLSDKRGSWEAELLLTVNGPGRYIYVHCTFYIIQVIHTHFLHVFKSQWFLFLIWIIIVLFFRSEKPPGKSWIAFFYQKLFWPFTVWINCSSDLKIFANSRPS